MTTNDRPDWGQIYNFVDFAARRRPPMERHDLDRAVVEDILRRPQTSFGDAWYHEEAIQDSGKPRPH